MASTSEIRRRIGGVRQTQKITHAMYLISQAKLRKAKQDLDNTRPYFQALQTEIGRVFNADSTIESRYVDPVDPNAKPLPGVPACLLITADKGLAGAYNHNIVKLEEEILSKPGQHKLFVVGELGRHYFAKKDVDIDTNFRYTVQKPTMHRARDISAVILDQFNNHELDEVYVVYTRMENAVQSEAEVLKLLPLERGDFGEMKMPLNMYREEIELNPSPMDVMNSIVPSYINGMIYGCLVEAYASEHNARMMAMKSATDSAQDLIKDLSILYNRARQAAITQEITEVCAGARAQQKKS